MKYFETIKCQDFEIFNLNYHQRRVSKTVGLNLNLQDYIYPPNSKLLRCKLIYNQSGVVSVDFFEYIQKDIKSFKLIFDDEIIYDKKYLNREKLDEIFAKKGNCDDIIIIKNGIVTDSSIANIAIFYKNEWIVSKDSLLEGSTKARLIENRVLKQQNISYEMLNKATKIATLNAMIGFNILEDYSFSL